MKKEATIFNVNEMAKSLGIPSTTIISVLGEQVNLPLTVDSIKQLKSAYHDTYDEAAKQKCSENWRSVSLLFLSSTNSIKEVNDAYMLCHPDEEVKSAYLKKWRKLFQNILLNAKNVKDAKIAYENVPVPYEEKDKFAAWSKMIELVANSEEASNLWHISFRKTEPKPKEMQLAEGKWIEVSLKEVTAADTLEEIKKIYDNCGAPYFLKRTQNEASNKWSEIAKNAIENSKNCIDTIAIINLLPARNSFHELILSKMQKQLKGFLENVKNFTEAEKVYYGLALLSRRYIDIAKEFEELKLKLISLAETPEQLSGISGIFDNNQQFNEKWRDLSRIELNKVQTLDDAKLAYKYAPHENEIRNEILKKIATFFGWKE